MEVSYFEQLRQSVIELFSRQALIPIVGAGISYGSPAFRGAVPSGGDMKSHMLSRLIGHKKFTVEEKHKFKNYSFQKLATLYFSKSIITHEESSQYLRENFFDAKIEDYRQKFFKINWPYIYSLNIDDAIENSTPYTEVILPCRKVKEDAFNKHKCLIKLHGDIREILKYHDAHKVFAGKEYAISMKENAFLLAKLSNDYQNLNIIYVGCSLEEETDLATLDLYKTNIVPIGMANRILFCTVDDVPLSKQIELEEYGITHIVKFESYESIYNELLKAWEESQKVSTCSLDEYANFNIMLIRQNYDSDKSFLLYGRTPIKKNTIELPSYYIKRSEVKKINDANILRNTRLHFIKGRRIAGKTYFLINLFTLFPGWKRYFFGNETKLNDKTFSNIMALQDSLVFFDAGSLSSAQFNELLKNLHSVHSNFFVVSGKDSSSLDSELIRALQNKTVNESDFKLYNISSTLDEEELNTINELLPQAYLPPFKDMSIMDNIISIADDLGKKIKYTMVRLKIENMRDMAYLILLATYKSLTTLNLAEFDLHDTHSKRLSNYSPLIEEVEINRFEKSGEDMSARRIVLNAPAWLYRRLGDLSTSEENFEFITSAYEFLVQRIIAVSRDNPQKRRKMMRDLIFFETINSIFAKRKHGQRRLIRAIYNKLRDTLANDYDFLHQSAKCDLWEEDSENKLETFKDAIDKLAIAMGLAENALAKTGSPYVQISIDHMEFTRATALSGYVNLSGYVDAEIICKALASIHTALYSPYNRDTVISLIRDRKPGRIIAMVDALMADRKLQARLPKESQGMLGIIWNMLREMRVKKNRN